VWQDGENVGGDIFYVEYDDGAWGTATQLSSPGGEVSTPSVAVDGDGDGWVAWVDHRYGESEICGIDIGEAGAGEEIRLSTATGSSMLPAVAANPNGLFSLVWTDMRSGTPDVYLRIIGGLSGVPGGPRMPVAWGLLEVTDPYPTPFGCETALRLSVAGVAQVGVDVFDIRGRRIRALANGIYDAGEYVITWDGRDDAGARVASGLYFIRCSTPGDSQVRRTVLAR